VSFSEAERLYAQASNNAGLKPVGVTRHIGSQITDLAPMAAAFSKMKGLVQRLRRRGAVGGASGPRRRPGLFQSADAALACDDARMIAQTLGDLDVAYSFEPGRMIGCNAGVLLALVLHIHQRPEGRNSPSTQPMNDLIRPAMDDAYHDIKPVAPRPGVLETYDVVGPICETGDTFTRERDLPPLEAGDLVAFLSAGHGAVRRRASTIVGYWFQKCW